MWGGKRVVITGHTGFKGAWLSELLTTFGAHVHGISLAPHATPNLFTDANLVQIMKSHNILDIRNYISLERAMSEIQPDFVFHLAAQSTVSTGYKFPRQTFEINTTGTVNVLMSSMSSHSLQGIFCATTDKVYENHFNTNEKIESDRLGAKDPYAASKVSAEFAIESLLYLFQERNIPLAVGRAGNVIGGGDWGTNRLIPDAVKSVIDNTVLNVRSPNSTRPWQHVLDCLSGYLLVANQIMKKEQSTPLEIYNFGPEKSLTVREVLEILRKQLAFSWEIRPDSSVGHEHNQLSLNSHKAKSQLGWECRFGGNSSIEETASWYEDFIAGQNAHTLMKSSIERFLKDEN